MIAVGGENLIDLVSTSSADGYPAYTAYPGGSPFNVAMAAGRQNAATAYLTPISSDRLGVLLAECLTNAGVTLAGGRSQRPTSLAVVSVHEGIPSYGFYREGTAERQITQDFLDRVIPQQANIVHLGSACLIEGADASAWEAQFSKWHRAGRLTCLDPNVRPSLVSDASAYRLRMKRMMGVADILKLSDEDLHWLYPDCDFETACAACFADSHAALSVITCGAEGVLAICGGRSVRLPAFPVRHLVDTVGAGDTFMASLLVWCADNQIRGRTDIETLGERNLWSMLARAAAAAALNCGAQGCQPPTKQQIDTALC